VNLKESMKIYLYGFDQMNMCVFCVDLKDRVSEFGDEFCEN